MEAFLIIRVEPVHETTEQGLPLFAMEDLNEDFLDWLKILGDTCQDLDVLAMTAAMPPKKWDKEDLNTISEDYCIVDINGLYRHEAFFGETLCRTKPIDIETLLNIMMNGPAFEPEDAGFTWVNGVLFYAEDPSDLDALIEDFRRSLTSA